MKLKPNRFKHRTIYGTTNFWGCGISFKMHSGNEKCDICLDCQQETCNKGICDAIKSANRKGDKKNGK